MDQHLLSFVLFTPLAGVLVLLLIPASSIRTLIRMWANIAAFAGFLIPLPLVIRFDKTPRRYQFIERADWIPSLGRPSTSIGIDGISLLLVMLTTVIGFLAILSSWNAIEDRLKEYYAMFLLLQTGMIGVFIVARFLPVLRFLGSWCWCRCTSSSACGAARASCTPPSSSSSTRWPARS